jgi:alpha-tubulin suppressor-like RCC1 family protein
LDGGARVATYNVYRADRGGSPIASVSAPTNTYVDSGLVNGSAYTYTVTAVNLVGEGPGASASAIPEALDHITVSPANSTISAGGAQTYDAQGFDASGNLIGDLTAATSFAIGPNGTCTVDTCTTTVAGDHVVTANLAGTTAPAALHVAPGFLDHMALSPATANVTAGGSTSYAAAGFDRFGNSLGDTTAGTTFSIIPDGSCAGATCLATDAGDHLVTGAATGTLTNTEVSARGFDACAVAADGTVKCWGDNSSGQLGNGTTTDSAIPVAVSNLPSAVASVSVGGSRSACALTAAGAVYCWGLNFYGQLGNGVSGFDSSGVYSMTPVAVSGLTTGVASISVGGGQACALTTAGSVYCWGWNGYGQLGNGTTTSSSVPVAVTGLTSGVQAISAGGVDTCAITAAGAVYCWGYGYSPVPEAISGLTSGVTSISAGQLYACAMTAGGALYCWGDNSEGQLGNGTTTSSSVPVAVSGLTAGVITVSAGMGASTCAVTTAGAVYCWGDDQLGQLGNGISSWGPNGYGSDVYSTTPVAVSGLTSGAAKVSAGSAFTCTLTTAGAVECWGYNGLGQLGVGLGGNQAFSLVPVDTRTATIATAALSACCGPLDHLALAPTNATILVGGSQTYSAQGYNNVNNSMGGMTGGATFSIAPDGSCVGATCTAAAIGPHTVKGTITSTSMSAGFMHTCAVSAIGGVTCWGWNAYGQLGDGTTTSSSTPGPVSGRFSDVVAISAGYRDTCAITAEGALYCWGDNSLGQLGDGTTMNSLVPVPVTGLASGVTAVSTGYDYSCAITTAGAVKCWGSSTMVPFTIPGLTSGVTAVSVGTDHICVIRFGGALCWGNNFYGGLGNGTTTAAFAPVAVSGLTSGVIAISAADASSCAVTTGGRLYCWGYNTSGQLGNGTATDSRVPVAVSGMTSGVTAVSVSSSGSTCAVATRGAVYCWGLNASGQLGNGTYANTSVPVPVTGLPNGATSVSLGGSDACALISRGAVYCWGYNGLGQLGGGAVASSAIPIDSGATTTATATLDVAHTFEGLPVISAVTPSAGPLTGGQLVTVTGSGFVAGMTATIGGTTVTPSGVTANSFTFTTPAESAGYDQVQVTTPAGVSALTLAAGYIYTGLGSFVPMTPFRILDTRSGLCGVHRCGALGAGQTLSLQVTGYTDARTTESVPANATAVVLNVLAVNGSSASLLTVYPNGTGRPLASNLNFPAHENVANLVTVALGQNGTSDTQREVNLYNALGTLNVVADVEGYFVAQAASNPAGEFHAIAPLRVCDTRAKQPANDCNQGHSTDNTIGPGQVLKVNVSGVPSGVGGSAASIPTDGTAGAAVLNLTAVAGTQATWLSAFPTQPNGTCLTSVPGSSTINVSAGGAEANRVMARLGPSHSGGPNTDVCVYNAAGTINVVLDASGWFGSATGSPPSGAQYQAIGPTRICDTRSGTGTLCSGHQLTSGGTQLVRVAGVGGIPGSGAVAIIANLTAVNGSQPTYLTVYPADVRSKPNASDLNLNPGIALPNLVVVGLASGAHPGDVNLFNAMGSINAVLDVDGWFQ